MSHFTLLTAIAPLEAQESVNPGTELDSVPDEILKLLGLHKSSVYEAYVADALESMMAPFDENPDDSAYLEFMSQDERERYETGVETLVQMPDGSLVSPYGSPFRDKFKVEDGIVYQCRYGKLKSKKRSKAAKKMKVLELPMKHRFATYDKYMREYCCYRYDEEIQAYGYYSNPNAEWDWYQIGGRWPFAFLVKEDCQSKVFGERSWGWDDEEFEKGQKGPEGYIWVAGAKKSDIAWDFMKELHIKDLTESFRTLEHWWKTGDRPEGLPPLFTLTDDGIQNWGDLAYAKDETLEQHLVRKGYGSDRKYVYITYAYLNDGMWLAKGDMGWWGISSNEKEPLTWHDMVERYISDVPDDYLLVSVDCHI